MGDAGQLLLITTETKQETRDARDVTSFARKEENMHVVQEISMMQSSSGFF